MPRRSHGIFHQLFAARQSRSDQKANPARNPITVPAIVNARENNAVRLSNGDGCVKKNTGSAIHSFAGLINRSCLDPSSTPRTSLSSYWSAISSRARCLAPVAALTIRTRGFEGRPTEFNETETNELRSPSLCMIAAGTRMTPTSRSRGVSNASRDLIVNCPRTVWSSRMSATIQNQYQLLYSGKPTNLRQSRFNVVVASWWPSAPRQRPVCRDASRRVHAPSPPAPASASTALPRDHR